jgi:hypothetical protein
MIRIYYNISIKKQIFSPEDFIKNVQTIGTEIGTGGPMEGTLVIENDSSGQKIILKDEIEPLIMNLCFIAPCELLDKGKFTYLFFSYPEELSMAIQNDHLSIQRESKIELWPKNELISQLYLCGKSYLNQMKSLRIIEYQDNINYLESYCQECERKLTFHNLL